MCYGRAWFKDCIAFDSKVPLKKRSKPFRMQKGVNTLVVEWQSNVDTEKKANDVRVQIVDPNTGKRLPDLLLDMEEK